jgi:RimJ/RimL family protein N-acetyltransferase
MNFQIPRLTKWVINDMAEFEKPVITAHLQRLDVNDRYLRFFAALNDFAVERYVNEMIDFKKQVGYGVYDIDKKTLIAFAHVTEDDNGTAEVGISVDKSLRGSGLARDLMERILVHCKATGIHTLFMSCLRENKVMQSIARKIGLHVVLHHDEAVAKLNLDINPIEKALYQTREYAHQQITIFDKCYRQNSLLVRYLFTGK